MPVQRLRRFLDENGVKYLTVSHSPAYTAQEIAASAHVKGRELAKTVMIKIDGEMAMAVLPASFQIDLDMLKKAFASEDVELASEDEFKGIFGRCELGAMPPFGNLYDLGVYVAQELTEDEEITFNAGSHTELVKLAYADYARLVQPLVLHFSALPRLA